MKTFFLIICLSILFIGNAFSCEYTKEEIEVAKTIAMEACGEGFIGMYAVVNVIANRSKEYNLTPFEVVSQKNQFAGYWHINRNKRFEECKEKSLYLSKNLLELTDITYGALYFKTQYEQKRKWHKVKTITIKKHEFWK
jgi:spore germination cell wall hydrolase CwlJ-like protein